MSLFNASSAALKSVSSKLRVGGPATMQARGLRADDFRLKTNGVFLLKTWWFPVEMQLFDVEDFLLKCKAAGIAVDFVTTHLCRDLQY